MVLSAVVRTPLLRGVRRVPWLETDQGTGGWQQGNGKRWGGLHGDQLALTHHESHDLGPRLWGSARADARKPHANARLAPHDRRGAPQSLLSLTGRFALTPHSQKSRVPPAAAHSRAFQGPLLFLWAFIALCHYLRSEDRQSLAQTITSPLRASRKWANTSRLDECCG